MVRAGKWLRSFLAGRKEKSQENRKDVETSFWLPSPPQPPPPPTSPKESIQKKRSFIINQEWKNPVQKDQFSPPPPARRHSISAPPAREAAPVYAGRAAGRKTRFIPIEEIAAIKIQSSFRSYLARKALRALKGVVKLQAMARGQLARKQAAASLRSAQGLSTAHTRSLAQRAQAIDDVHDIPWKESFLRKMMVEFKLKAGSRNGKSDLTTHSSGAKEHRAFSIYPKAPSSPSDSTGTSSGASSGRFEEPSAAAANGGSQFSPAASRRPPGGLRYFDDSGLQEGSCLASHESGLCPNYMANTESWRAKARSQTAPRQRHESADQKQPGRRRAAEGRSLGRVASSKDRRSWCDELDRHAAAAKAGYRRFIVA